MPELIDKIEALGKLQTMYIQIECACGDGNPVAKGVRKAYKAIERIPTIEAEPVRHGRWIPCRERLPENDAKCLVYTSDKRVCMARWYEKYDEQGAWYIISDDVPKLYRIKNVPFWMPLPEPPKE